MFKRARSVAVLLLACALCSAAQTEHHGDSLYLACRALEVHSDSQLKVAVIVFHQADESQRAELAQLLRDHSGETVEIQGTEAGGWQRAQMVRMKSCFGRGLLMMTAPAPVSDGSHFLLRIPNPGSSSSQN